jgi:hypothetical protein
MIFRILEDQLAQKSKQSKEVDRRFMQLALTLGRRGQGRTWPNPPSARSWSRMASLSAAAGPNPAAVRMPSGRR